MSEDVLMLMNAFVYIFSLPLEQGALEASAHSIKNGEFRNLVDFDNHLDNISLDWRNRDLVDV